MFLFVVKMSKAKSLHYKLYVINTDEKIQSCLDFLNDKTKNTKEIGPIRKDFTRNIITREYTESSRKFVILDMAFYQRLKNSGYGEDGEKSENFLILPYILRNEDFAHKKSSLMHYYFPLEVDQDNLEIIRSKMDSMTYLKIINNEDWHIHDCGVVEFSKNVNSTTRVIMKIMLDDPSDCRVSWIRHDAWNRIDAYYIENEKTHDA